MHKKKFRWTALKLTIIISIVFILQVIFKELTESFMLVSSDVYSRPWILITSIFLHGSITHLLYNMFALFLFGSFLEKKIGSRNFLIVFFLTGIIASLIASLFYERSLGASGAVYGVIGMLTVLQPLMPIWAFGVPMPIIVASVLWIFIDFASFTSYLKGMPGGIANAAHLAGIFSGALFGLILRYFDKWKRKKERRIKNIRIRAR